MMSMIGEQGMARLIGGYDHKWTLAAFFFSYAVVALAWIMCALSPWWLFIRMGLVKKIGLQMVLLVAGYLVSILLAVIVDFPSPD